MLDKDLGNIFRMSLRFTGVSNDDLKIDYKV